MGETSGLDIHIFGALAKCGPAGRVGAPIIRPLLEHEDESIRQMAADFLAAAGEDATKAKRRKP